MENRAAHAHRLRSLRLFRDLSAGSVSALLAAPGVLCRSYPKTTAFLHQGDEYTKLCIVFEGTCISEMNDYTGRSVVLGTFPAPFPVAPGFLFADDPRLPISLRARTAVDVLLIPKSVISSFLHQNPRFTAGFLTLLSNRIGYLTERVSFHSCKTIREKLLSYLYSLSNEEDSTVTISMSMEELARYFGVARPSLSQGFIDLQKEGRIRKDGRRVTLIGNPWSSQLCRFSPVR